MGQEQAIQATDERSRLLAAARAMVLNGEKKFSISRLCGQAGLARASLAEYLSSRTELMAELMAEAADGAPAETPAEMAGEDSVEESVEDFGETFAAQSAEAPFETSAETSAEASVEAPIDVQPAEPAPVQMSAATSAEASVETQVQAPAPARPGAGHCRTGREAGAVSGIGQRAAPGRRSPGAAGTGKADFAQGPRRADRRHDRARRDVIGNGVCKPDCGGAGCAWA